MEATYMSIDRWMDKEIVVQQMEKYTMFMDWKNQYCQNDYTAQSNL